jgi:hypothetical protein
MSSIIESTARTLAEAAKVGIYTDEQINALVKAVEEADSDPDGKKAEYRTLAKQVYDTEGDLEFDEGSIVSISEDGGAYVQCWKYVELE